MLIAGLALVTVIVPSTDAQQRACTFVGCTSGVTVDVGKLRSSMPRARTVTLCVDNHCLRRSATVGESVGVSWIDAPRSGTGPYVVLIVLRDRNHRAVLRVRRTVKLIRSQPNGPECEPTCFYRRLNLDVRRRRLDLVA